LQGFDASMTATRSGQGVVIMINANENSDVFNSPFDSCSVRYTTGATNSI